MTPNSIAISTKVFMGNPNSDDRAEKLSELLEKIFQSDFTSPFTLTKKTFSQETKIAENSLLINPDINYINWALRNVEFFMVNPIFLNETFKLKRLKSFNTKRLNKTIFEYDPVIENIEYDFPDLTKKINQQKFEKTNQVLVDYENKLLVPNLTEEERMLQYGYYLDETYQASISNDSDCGDYDAYDDYHNRESYGQYAGSYAQDVEGLSDDFIDDVLDGDPDAYWNID